MSTHKNNKYNFSQEDYLRSQLDSAEQALKEYERQKYKLWREWITALTAVKDFEIDREKMNQYRNKYYKPNKNRKGK